MSQKPIVMEQLKQILQLRTDGIPIREIARRIGVSRNSVRKYLGLLEAERVGALSDKELADKAYHTAQLAAGALPEATSPALYYRCAGALANRRDPPAALARIS